MSLGQSSEREMKVTAGAEALGCASATPSGKHEQACRLSRASRLRRSGPGSSVSCAALLESRAATFVDLVTRGQPPRSWTVTTRSEATGVRTRLTTLVGRHGTDRFALRARMAGRDGTGRGPCLVAGACGAGPAKAARGPRRPSTSQV